MFHRRQASFAGARGGRRKACLNDGLSRKTIERTNLIIYTHLDVECVCYFIYLKIFMIESFNFKLIKSGKEIETYDYRTKNILRGYHVKTKKSKKEEMSKKEMQEIVEAWGDENEIAEIHRKQTARTAFSIARTRNQIRRLANSNHHLNSFLTLTFDRLMPNLADTNKLFNLFVKRMVRKEPNFQYIAVNEFQGDFYFRTGERKPEGGSVHYHLLCNFGCSETTDERRKEWERRFAKKYWRNGFIKIEPIEHVTNMGAYFCKYLSKDMFDKRMFGKKKFFCSQTLSKPIEMTGNKARKFFNDYVKSTTPVFVKQFFNIYAGKVDYTAYSLTNDVSLS